MKSGFATMVGRPNVGKSTLVNAVVGTKVSITSDKPQTTRSQIRGIFNGADAQIVFVDTPGIHKPRTPFGERLNAAAQGAVSDTSDIDVVCFVIDATAPIGKGDRFVAGRLAPSTICVVNKIDAVAPSAVVTQLARAGTFGFSEYFPVSAVTGEGMAALVDGIVARLGEGPAYYPPEMASDVGEVDWVAELVREQLLIAVHDELPHAIACRVTEWEWPRIRCEILVERDSQKGIVIGKSGSVLKAVGTAVRAQLEPGAYLELVVSVEADWRRRYTTPLLP